MIMKNVVYIAGAYTSSYRDKILGNIHRAVVHAAIVRRAGFACIVPHLESLFSEDSLTEEGWLAHGVALMERCDAVYILPESENSKGTQAEIEVASYKGIPIARGLGELEGILRPEMKSWRGRSHEE